MSKQIYNFCAGPAMLPVEVMERAQREFCNFQGLGASVMELSHRGKPYMAVAEKAEADLRDLLAVPDNYKVLFMHGGGRGQFSAVPMNLLGGANKKADYLVTGVWAQSAVDEAQKYGDIQTFQGVAKNEQGSPTCCRRRRFARMPPMCTTARTKPSMASRCSTSRPPAMCPWWRISPPPFSPVPSM